MQNQDRRKRHRMRKRQDKQARLVLQLPSWLGIDWKKNVKGWKLRFRHSNKDGKSNVWRNFQSSPTFHQGNKDPGVSPPHDDNFCREQNGCCHVRLVWNSIRSLSICDTHGRYLGLLSRITLSFDGCASNLTRAWMALLGDSAKQGMDSLWSSYQIKSIHFSLKQRTSHVFIPRVHK